MARARRLDSLDVAVLAGVAATLVLVIAVASGAQFLEGAVRFVLVATAVVAFVAAIFFHERRV